MPRIIVACLGWLALFLGNPVPSSNGETVHVHVRRGFMIGLNQGQHVIRPNSHLRIYLDGHDHGFVGETMQVRRNRNPEWDQIFAINAS